MHRLSGLLSLAFLLASLGLVVPAEASDDALRVTATRIIGYSVKGRPIRAYRIGEPSAAVKAVFVGGIHGDEDDPSKILLNLRGGDPIKGADIWVIPFFNPDGVARHTRQNAHGVDLNRNFPVGWTRLTGKYYSGRRPASEPETRALMRFLGNIKPRFVVGLHQPLFGVDVSYGKSRAFALRLAEGLELPRKIFNCNSGCHGTMTQWFNKRQPGIALTVEYGRTVSQRQINGTGPSGLLQAVFAKRVPA